MLRPRRSSHVLALLITAALLLVACGGSDDPATGQNDEESTSTTAAEVEPNGASGRSDGASGSPEELDGLGDPAPAPASTGALPSNKRGAPLPGRYFYDVAGAKRPVELSVRDTLGGQDPERFDRTGDLFQVHTEVEGAEARASLVHWGADGMRLDAEQRGQNTTGGMNESPTCDYEPNLLIQGAAPAVGARWSDASTCSVTRGDVTVRRERSVSSEVTGRSAVAVGGRDLETLRIRRVTDTTTTADSSPPLLVVERRELTIDWHVATGLAVRVEGTIVETVSGSAKPARTFTWTLRSTTPA